MSTGIAWQPVVVSTRSSTEGSFAPHLNSCMQGFRDEAKAPVLMSKDAPAVAEKTKIES